MDWTQLLARLRPIIDSITPSAGSASYLASFSPEDQARIRASWADPNLSRGFGGLPNMAGIVHQGRMQNQWYQNALADGAVPAPPAGVNPALVGATLNAFGGGGTAQPRPAPAPATAPAGPRVGPQTPTWRATTPAPTPMQAGP